MNLLDIWLLKGKSTNSDLSRNIEAVITHRNMARCEYINIYIYIMYISRHIYIYIKMPYDAIELAARMHL